jgi:sugar lactone lactonase YvrE
LDLEVVQSGFGLLESPRADGADVWFTDMALGGVHRFSGDGRLQSWLPERRMIGGLAFNRDGAVLCSGTGGIVWFHPITGESGILLDAIDGEPIAGVNDMTADERGGLLFGTVDHARMFRGEPYFGRSRLYRLTAQRQLLLLCEGLGFANGLGVSPDGRLLYLNNSGVGTFVHEQLEDGRLGPGTQLSNRPDCDGLALDCQGSIWIACISSGMLVRLTPEGHVDEQILVAGGAVTSLCFGGPDGLDIYVTTSAPGAGAAVVRRAIPESRIACLLRGRAAVAGMAARRTHFDLTGKGL